MTNIDTISMGMNIHKSQLYIDVNQKGVQADLTHPQMGVFRNGDTQKLMVDDGHPIKIDWLVVDLPLWKICESQLGLLFPTIGENKIHVPVTTKQMTWGYPHFRKAPHLCRGSLRCSLWRRRWSLCLDESNTGKGTSIYRSKRVSHVHVSWFITVEISTYFLRSGYWFR